MARMTRSFAGCSAGAVAPAGGTSEYRRRDRTGPQHGDSRSPIPAAPESNAASFGLGSWSRIGQAVYAGIPSPPPEPEDDPTDPPPNTVGRAAGAGDPGIRVPTSKAKPADCRCPQTKQPTAPRARACACHTSSADGHDALRDEPP